jgi:uncharacterized protein YjbI with pentapeptide repeats
MKNQSMGLMRGVLQNAKADGADFTGANLSRADLQFGSFKGARFTDADLRMATLGGADLTGAAIGGARFDNADVTSTRLREVEGAENSSLGAARNLDRAFRN